MAAPTKATETTTKDQIRLPMWGWAVLGGITLVVGWRFYQARKASQTASTGGDAASTTQAAANQSQYSLIPVPVATTTGNSPAEEQNYTNLLGAINSLQGQGSTSSADQCVKQIYYKVGPGETLASIGAKYGISGPHLFANITDPTVEDAGTAAANKSRGLTGNYNGQVVLVPWNACIANKNTTVGSK